MASYTEHYGLHQWAPEDDFLRTDFNTDFQKIDTAIAEKPEFVFGTYTGDGTARRHIELGFRPKSVMVVGSSGVFSESGNEGGFVLDGYPILIGFYTHMEIEDGGFAVYYHYDLGNSTINKEGTIHYYQAMR